MAATATAPPAMSPSGASGAVDHEDSNVSSPLSEVDDKDTNDEDINMNLEDGDDNGSSLTAEDQHDAHNDGSDSESALSDARSVVNSEANDTEAETERLYDTPQKDRQRDFVVDQYNDGQVFEHTPSKLRRTAAVDDQDHPDNESVPGDAESSASEKSDIGESPSKIINTKDTSVEDEQNHDSQERKRKRSPAADTSESEQPLRKRTGSVGAAGTDIDRDLAVDGDEAASVNDRSGSHLPADEGEASPQKQDITIENSVERETRASKITRNGVKRKTSAPDDVEDDVAVETHDEDRENGAEEEPVPHDEAADAEAEEEAEAAARSAEEAERKQAAFKDWSRIEEMFGTFRDRLYKDRLQRLEEEEQSLLADEPTHPEYLNMKQCIDDRLNRKLRAIDEEHKFRTMANERRAVAVRSQIWSQYFQAVREKRETVLEALNREWYDVQAARRSAHSLPNCGILFPKDPAQRVRNAVAYNTEVSTLAGIAKYEGFPAGPDIKGASSTELADDLAAIDQARRGRSKHTFQPAEEYQTPSFNRLGPAGEQFLKDTPWANPNHSAHKTLFQQSQTSQLDGRAEPAIAGGRGTQPAPAPSATTAAVDGPISQQRSPALSRLSESPELARTALRPGPTMKRTSLPSGGRGTKAAAV